MRGDEFMTFGFRRHKPYHQTIFDRLASATAGLTGSQYADALRAELNSIAVEAQTVGSTLNKLLTEK